MRIPMSRLDFKLGFRMLIKYPWLTLVGGLGIAVAVAIGASFFGVIDIVTNPSLPLEDGKRIVSIQVWQNSNSNRPTLHDFAAWRTRLKSVEELGAWRQVGRNMVAASGDVELARVAEMTASGFRIARVQPLVGRYLSDEDERADARPVVVIGYDVWRTHFALDSNLPGKTLRLGNTVHQVVGVMPQSFGFPINHQIWVPLQLNAADFAAGDAPRVGVFGRLARGVTFEEAQAELATLRTEDAQPRVWPFAYPYFEVDDAGGLWVFRVFQLSISLLLVLVCANVAVVIYARTATRLSEITVRSALGASRLRIIGQLFAEALVLSSLAAVVGLLIARWALQQLATALGETFQTPLPFWLRAELPLSTILYALGLAVLAAVIVGVVPALNATGRRVQSQLRQLGGGTGMRLGKTWTALIVAQVAFAVALLPATLTNAWQFARYAVGNPSFSAQEYLTALLTMERQTVPSAQADAYQQAFATSYTDARRRLVARLAAEPNVSAVTYASNNPGEEYTAMIEVEGLPLPKDSVNYSLAAGTRHGYGVRTSRVDIDYFKTFEVSIVAGRGFQPADRDPAATAVIANETFVQNVLGGADAVGRRFRYVGRGGDTDSASAPIGRMFQIVGVVADFPPRELNMHSISAKLYHPPSPAQTYALLLVRVANGSPAAFVSRLRQVGAQVDPTLQLREIQSLDQSMAKEQRIMRIVAVALTLMTVSVLLLTTAGIYALMSVAVTQRRREIGVRAALGAQPGRILVSIFSRAARHVAIGAVVGLTVAAVLERLMWGELLVGNASIVLPAMAVLMLTVGLLAALGPARRGLRIQPTEALKEL